MRGVRGVVLIACGVAAGFIASLSGPQLSVWDIRADAGPSYFRQVFGAAAVVFVLFGAVLLIRDLVSYLKRRLNP